MTDKLAYRKIIGHSKKQIKSHFSPEEDEYLKFLVGQYGEDKWEEIAGKFENRNTRQVRERWFKYLSPKLKIGDWTPEEDDLLLDKVAEIGGQWKFISFYFSGRTNINIRSRYLLLQRRASKGKTIYPDKLSNSKVVVKAAISEIPDKPSLKNTVTASVAVPTKDKTEEFFEAFDFFANDPFALSY